MRKKKSLGQHFLRDRSISQKIADSVPVNNGGRIVEIGGGSGALTEYLLKQRGDAELHVIEIDQVAVSKLRNKFENITIHHTDVLKADWKKLTADAKKVDVVGNLPYYLTTPILFKLLSHRRAVNSAVLMMQKEVAERIVSASGNKSYGILSVQLQLMANAELLFDVPPSAFIPPPKVQSSVIRFKFKPTELACEEKHLKKVVKTAFNQRRKKLSNALAPILGNYIPDAIDLNKRAEKITPGEYEMLTAELEKNDIL